MQHYYDFLTLGFWAPGPLEWAVIGVVAVLLFGRRLPELGRSLGRGLVEFKKGLHDVQNEVTHAGEDEPGIAQMPQDTKPDKADEQYDKQ